MRQMAAFLTLVLLASSACVGPDVQTDFDPFADFLKFRTYAFADLTDLNRGGVVWGTVNFASCRAPTLALNCSGG